MNIIKNNQLIARLARFFKKHKIIALILSAVFILIIGAITFLILSQKPETNQAPKKSVKTVETIKYYSPLTGQLVKQESDTKLPVTGIMIENSTNARPQSGLKDSGVVFEAIAEGGITRFLVLYQQEKPQIIGPVRSLRLYDAEWLAAFDASIAHVGGSAAALREVRDGSYRDIDQFFNSGSYWRASDRYAPHNVYTSFEKIDALNKSKGYNSSDFTGFSRKDGKAIETPDASSLNIEISSSLYNSTYTYDKASNTYARYQAGEAHLDRESGQIKPSVVIAMYVDESTVLEDGNRENIITIGNGKAVIFQDGTAINVTWHKAGRTEQITFTDADGKDVPLTRGQTWISAIPNDDGKVTWQ